MNRSRLFLRILLAAAAGGCVLLAVWARFGGPALPAGRAGFLVLLAAEMALLDAAQSSRATLRRAALIAAIGLPLAVALGVRAYVGVRVRDFLDWDEVYYLSTAVTANAGGGLYPYVSGYGAMPIQGGVGYFAYVYVAVVHFAGPNIAAMRAASQLASAGGLVALWFLLRTLYGSTTAWMGAALASTLTLFMLAGTARMDGITFGVVMAGLLAVVKAVQRPAVWRGHFVAGLVFGLALQAHIDAVITAIGCGVLYVVLWARALRSQRRFSMPSALLSYGAGYGVGAILYFCFNVLPDPDAYYRTTALVRLHITNWYSSGTTSLSGSFFDPRILASKQIELYRVLWHAVSPVEFLVVLAGIGALLVRRSEADRLLAIVIGGVLAASAVILLHASALYYIHVMPALAIPVAPLLTHGLKRESTTARERNAGFGSWIAFALIASFMCASSSAKLARKLHPTPDNQATDLAFAREARAATSPQCVVAGDAGLYIRYFPDYPHFISARPAEVAIAMLYYGVEDEAAFWEIKSPTAIFWPGQLSDGLAGYATKHGMTRAADGVWVDAGRCGPAK